MKQTSIPMEGATDAQLRQFATETLGLEIHPQLGREKMLAKIKQAWGSDKTEILVPEIAAPELPPTGLSPAARIRDGVRSDGKVVVFIPEVEGPGGQDYVPLSVNGRAMAVERNKASALPYPYYVALLHAQTHRYEMAEDGQHVNPIPRVILTFPFNLMSPPEDVEAAQLFWSPEAIQEREDAVRLRNQSKKVAAKAA